MDGILAPWHWIILIAVILLIFGPRKLPELGNSLGRSITGFKKGLKEVQEDMSASTSEAEKPQPVAPTEPARAQSTTVEEDEAKPQV